MKMGGRMDVIKDILYRREKMLVDAKLVINTCEFYKGRKS